MQVGPFHNDNKETKETCQQVNSVELQKRLISVSDQCGLVLLLRATIEIMQNNQNGFHTKVAYISTFIRCVFLYLH